MSENFLNSLNESQQDAAKHIDGALLILSRCWFGVKQKLLQQGLHI